MTTIEGIAATQKKINDNNSLDIGNIASVVPIIKIFKVEQELQQHSTIISERDTSTDMIWGREDWGSPNDWNDGYANSPVIKWVVNPNNQFRESFRTATFFDTVNSNATWDYTTDYRLEFTAGQYAQTKSIYLNDDDILKAQVNIDGTNVDNITISISADGGNTWLSVDNGSIVRFREVTTDYTFDTGLFDVCLFDNGGFGVIGDDLRVKFVEIATGTATITDFSCKYNFEA